MDVILKYKNNPEMGQSKCKIKDVCYIEFDNKNKIIFDCKNQRQLVKYSKYNEEVTVEITFKLI